MSQFEEDNNIQFEDLAQDDNAMLEIFGNTDANTRSIASRGGITATAPFNPGP
jgi:hypothetical protein